MIDAIKHRTILPNLQTQSCASLLLSLSFGSVDTRLKAAPASAPYSYSCGGWPCLSLILCLQSLFSSISKPDLVKVRILTVSPGYERSHVLIGFVVEHNVLDLHISRKTVTLVSSTVHKLTYIVQSHLLPPALFVKISSFVLYHNGSWCVHRGEVHLLAQLHSLGEFGGGTRSFRP